MPDLEQSKLIWSALTRALGAEPRQAATIRGASGLDHEVEAIAVDDKGHRVIIISAEPSPRVSALMQVDIQATMPTARVLVARPIMFDIAFVARGLVQHFGWDEIDFHEISERIKEQQEGGKQPDPKVLFGGILNPIFTAFQNVRLPPLNQILAFVQQAALLDWDHFIAGIGENQKLRFPVSDLLTLDSMEIDRRHGICPIPLYELTEADWELLLSGARTEMIEARLRELGIYQYFYPAPDQLALGVADRNEGRASAEGISSALTLSDKLGHPIGKPEVLQSITHLREVAEQLKDNGMLVEGEFGLEMTDAGTSARASVKFRPRESALTKLLQRLNVNLSVSAKDFIPPQ